MLYMHICNEIDRLGRRAEVWAKFNGDPCQSSLHLDTW